MRIRCPKCDSRDIRYSYLSTPKERLASLIGYRPLRCRECRERFVARIWDPANLPYAQCPKCLNMSLATWSPRHYHVTAWRAFRMFFGASPYRCEPCRCNFVSFRPRKYKYKRGKPGLEAVPDTGLEEGVTATTENGNGSK
jgi:hypothetical protein